MLTKIALLAAATATAATAETHHGYSKNELGADFLYTKYNNKCGYDYIWNDRVAAGEAHFAYVMKPDWNNASVCGQCATVRDPTRTDNNSVTVMIISYDDNDLCPVADSRCLSGSLMLSPQAVRALNKGIGGSSQPIEWEITPCPSEFVQGNMQLYFGSGSGSTYLAVQPRNFFKTVSQMDAVFEDGSVITLDPPYTGASSWRVAQYFSYAPQGDNPSPLFDKPFTLRVHSADSADVVEAKVTQTPSSFAVITADGQFQSPPVPTSSPTTTPPAAATPSPSSGSSCSTPSYGNCGNAQTAPACCASGQYCQPWNDGYYQCITTPPQCAKQYTNVDLYGNDIKTVYGVQPDQCCAECAATAGCKAYTFVNNNPGSPACYSDDRCSRACANECASEGGTALGHKRSISWAKNSRQRVRIGPTWGSGVESRPTSGSQAKVTCNERGRGGRNSRAPCMCRSSWKTAARNRFKR